MAAMSHKPTPTTLTDVRSIAVVGVSNQKTKFGSAAFRELKKRGYDVYPVHSSLDTFDNTKCYQSVNDLPLVPDCVLVAVKPDTALEVVRQATAKGVRKVWFQQGANFSAAIAEAEKADLEIVSRRCILMYAGPVTGIHRFHRFLNRLFGRY